MNPYESPHARNAHVDTPARRRALWLWRIGGRLHLSYVVILLASALGGVYLSFGAQPGGIGQLNAFLAPLMGPWSKVLSPNAVSFQYWEQRDFQFAVFTTVFTIGSVVVASMPKNWIVRICTTVIAHLAVVFWCLCGLAKVVLEMS